jgi:hypothetical protein
MHENAFVSFVAFVVFVVFVVQSPWNEKLLKSTS